MQPLKDLGRTYTFERRACHAARSGFRIAELQIGPQQAVPWHYHSEAQDTFYVIDGTIRVFTREPEEKVCLTAGQTYPVRPGRPHLVANAGNNSAVFLVLQGIGEHDFVALPEGALQAPARKSRCFARSRPHPVVSFHRRMPGATQNKPTSAGTPCQARPSISAHETGASFSCYVPCPRPTIRFQPLCLPPPFTGSMRTSAQSPTSSRRTASLPRRPTCLAFDSGAAFPRR